jgi:polyisoprenoid-binding protein YceI
MTAQVRYLVTAAIDPAGYQLAVDPPVDFRDLARELTSPFDPRRHERSAHHERQPQGDTMNAKSPTAQAQKSLADTRWRLDPSASTAEFQVPHFWGLVTVKGHFERVAGYLELDDRQQRQMTLTIDAASLHTGISRRDKHLRSGDFFDTDSHPEVRFRSTSVSDIADNRVRVEGQLEAAGERLAMTLEPTIHQTSDRLEIDVTTTIDQRQLGMTWSPLGMTRSPVTLTVHASLRRRS